MATTSLQRRVRLGGRLRLGRGLRARSRLRVGPHALAKGMLEGLPYVAILLLLLLLLLVLFLILLFIFLFLLCESRLSTRQSKVDGTLGDHEAKVHQQKEGEHERGKGMFEDPARPVRSERDCSWAAEFPSTSRPRSRRHRRSHGVAWGSLLSAVQTGAGLSRGLPPSFLEGSAGH